MDRSRAVTAAAGILGSLAVSALLWWYFHSVVFFLFVPFVPFLFRYGNDEERRVRQCPSCGFQTTNDAYEYCPRDGTPLRSSAHESQSS